MARGAGSRVPEVMPAAEVTLAVGEASSGAEAAGEAADAAMADTGTKRRRPPKPTSKSSPRTTEAVVHWKRRCLISALRRGSVRSPKEK